MGHIK